MADKVYVDWREVEKYIVALASNIRLNNPELNKGVYAIPKGGLVLGVMLANHLNVPLLAAPCDNCIVIDDIADTGVTLKHYAEKGYYISTMFFHEQSIVEPNFWWKQKYDEWIVYPWEIN